MNDVFYKPIFSIISVNVHWMIHILAIIVDKHVNINDVSPDKKWDMILSIFSECNTCKDIRFEIWRLYSYSLVHKGLDHLCLNIVAYIFTVIPLEILIGRKVMIYYGSSIIFSGMSIGVFSPYTSLVGLSGAIYGFIGGLTSYYFMQFNVLNYSMKVIWGFLIVFLLVLEITLYLNDRDDGTAYYCHLIGYLNTFFLGFICIKPKKKKNIHEVLKLLSIFSIASMWIYFIYNYIELDYAKKKKYSSECCYIKN